LWQQQARLGEGKREEVLRGLAMLFYNIKVDKEAAERQPFLFFFFLYPLNSFMK
jgi:hypothetical protein